MMLQWNEHDITSELQILQINNMIRNSWILFELETILLAGLDSALCEKPGSHA